MAVLENIVKASSHYGWLFEVQLTEKYIIYVKTCTPKMALRRLIWLVSDRLKSAFSKGSNCFYLQPYM